MSKTIKNMMAKGVAIVLVALCALATACSSDDDPVKRDPDVAVIDYVVGIRVVNEEGRNLLDSREADHILKDGVMAIMEGKEYRFDTAVQVAENYTPAEQQVVLKRFAPPGTRNYIMYFGPFNGKQNVSNRAITLRWNKGRKDDVILVNHTYTENADHTQGTMTTTYTLNNQPVDKTPITIVLK